MHLFQTNIGKGYLYWLSEDLIKFKWQVTVSML